MLPIPATIIHPVRTIVKLKLYKSFILWVTTLLDRSWKRASRWSAGVRVLAGTNYALPIWESRSKCPGSQNSESPVRVFGFRLGFQPRVSLLDYALVRLLEKRRRQRDRRPGAHCPAVVVRQCQVALRLFLVLDHVLRAEELAVVAQVLVEPLRRVGQDRRQDRLQVFDDAQDGVVARLGGGCGELVAQRVGFVLAQEVGHVHGGGAALAELPTLEVEVFMVTRDKTIAF
jgi:hypothetical protein